MTHFSRCKGISCARIQSLFDTVCLNSNESFDWDLSQSWWGNRLDGRFPFGFPSRQLQKLLPQMPPSPSRTRLLSLAAFSTTLSSKTALKDPHPVPHISAFRSDIHWQNQVFRGKSPFLSGIDMIPQHTLEKLGIGCRGCCMAETSGC